VERLERSSLVTHVDEDGACGHNIDAGVHQGFEILRSGDNKRHPIAGAELLSEPCCVSDQISRDIRQHDGPRRTHSVERPERDQSIAAANIQNGLSSPDAGVIEYSITDRQEMFERLGSLLLVATIPPFEEPRCPFVEITVWHCVMLGAGSLGRARRLPSE
jgi:hypothetical protein